MAIRGMRYRCGRVWPWVVAALVFLPTPLLQVQGFARHNNPPSTWYPNDPDEITIFDYVRDHTPANTVVLDSQLAYSPPASCYARRRGYFGGLELARILGYPIREMERRDRVCTNLFSESNISNETLHALDELGTPTYVVGRRMTVPQPGGQGVGGGPSDPVAKLDQFPALFHPILRTSTMVLYQYRPAG